MVISKRENISELCVNAQKRYITYTLTLVIRINTDKNHSGEIKSTCA